MAKKTLYEDVIIAGFGGQGIVLAGKLLAQTAMEEGFEVTFMPAYGAEVRGGTSNCIVTISTEPIASPVTVNPKSLIIMNQASMTKFASRLRPHGCLVYNSSMIDTIPALDKSIAVCPIPADEIAVELKSPRSTNMVVLGAYLQMRSLFSADAAARCLSKTLAERLHKTIPLNTQALQKGSEYAKKITG